MKRALQFTLIICCFFQCSVTDQVTKPPGSTPLENGPEIRYLALGDSYTIGEGVLPDQRFPAQLAESLGRRGFNVAEVKVVARTGWTTEDLQTAIKAEQIPTDRYAFVSLLIGVNNQFRGYPVEQFEREFTDLLTGSIRFAGGRADRVFVLSIPDYGVTPFAQSLDPRRIGMEIDLYNEIKERICKEAGVTFVEITGISREAQNEPDLIAGDRLHPSSEMYARWVAELLPEVLKVF